MVAYQLAAETAQGGEKRRGRFDRAGAAHAQEHARQHPPSHPRHSLPMLRANSRTGEMHAQESARDTRGGTRGVAGRAATAYLPRRVLSFGLVVTAALTGVACANCQAASARACGDRGRWAVRDCAAREVDCLLRLRGGRKGVAAKHTAKEMALKTKLATKNMGGGKEGLADRQGGKAGHAKVVRACEHASACVVCVCDWLRQTSVARCMRARTSFRCCALGAAGACSCRLLQTFAAPRLAGPGHQPSAALTLSAPGRMQFQCPLPGCNMQAPSLKNMQMHHDSKHPKIPWDPSIYPDLQAWTPPPPPCTPSLPPCSCLLFLALTVHGVSHRLCTGGRRRAWRSKARSRRTSKRPSSRRKRKQVPRESDGAS